MAIMLFCCRIGGDSDNVSFLVGQNAQKSDDVIDQREQFQTEPVFTEGEFINEPADLIASERIVDKAVSAIDIIVPSEEARIAELAADLGSLEPLKKFRYKVRFLRQLLNQSLLPIKLLRLLS